MRFYTNTFDMWYGDIYMLLLNVIFSGYGNDIMQ
jgi:hypothetical protein